MSTESPSTTTTIYDTIIIGGGPAGAACAYDLASDGKKVLIIEKDTFPRFKPCAGMLTIKSLNQLPYSIAPIVQWKSDSITLTRNFQSEKAIAASKDVIVTTVRSELDEYSLNKAMQVGAEVKVFNKGFQSYKDESGVMTIVVAHKNNEGTEIKSEFKGYFLVGADGPHSKVRKQSKQFVPDRTAIALEGRIPLSRISSSNVKTDTQTSDSESLKPPYTKELRFDFNVVKKGYGWLIPKGDHINVGLYTRRPDEYPISKAQLQDYTEKLLGTREIDELLGFPVGTGGEYYQPSQAKASPANLLLVGDAAGMAEPIFGEGIHNAIKSGRAAAHAIKLSLEVSQSKAVKTVKSQALIDAYMAQLEAVVTDVWWCRQIARPFYKFLVPALAVLQRKPVRVTVMEGFSDGLTIKECLKQMSPIHTAKPYPNSQTINELSSSSIDK